MAFFFEVEEGTEYQLTFGRDRGADIASSDWKTDPWARTSFQLKMLTPPANDHLADAIHLGNDNIVEAWSSSILASREEQEPASEDPENTGTVWWNWTAPESGDYRVFSPNLNQSLDFDFFTKDQNGALNPLQTGFLYSREIKRNAVFLLRATSGVRYFIRGSARTNNSI